MNSFTDIEITQLKKEEEKEAAKGYSLGFVISVSLFSLITAVMLFKDEEKKTLVRDLLRNKLFMTSLITIIGFSIYTLNIPIKNNEIKRIHGATKQALLGFMIAILAYLDLKAAPFWIIWLASYYLNVNG